ncbi:hypothetical protein [Dyadobacter sp. CY356]|nr:hypothetical protein [Dyadobacter sp. CY356]MCF0057407.1 hypothetical protein [Dyadobacter sp. CY356]MCF0059297.1 hypothetical protein [Dyadobacter sp. CY356]
MSKNCAPRLPKLDALIVLSAVLPDWECKGAPLFFHTQVQGKSILKVFLK